MGATRVGVPISVRTWEVQGPAQQVEWVDGGRRCV